jgi:hypothetical protein
MPSDPSEPPSSPQSPTPPIKGRGAGSNLQGRHESLSRASEDDGWPGTHDESDDTPSAPKTRVIEEYAKSILTRNASPDLPFSVPSILTAVDLTCLIC